MTTPTVASIRASLGEGSDGESIRRLARLAEADPARTTPALLSHLRLHSVQVRVTGSIWGI
jgi:hypothetical protein